MLSRRHRVHRKKDIELIFRKGAKLAVPPLVVRAVRNGLSYSRFTVIVPAKVVSKATARNRVKRILREALRRGAGRFTQGFDYVVLLTARPEKINQQWAEQKVEEVCKKL